jgi:hypothetical protein
MFLGGPFIYHFIIRKWQSEVSGHLVHRLATAPLATPIRPDCRESQPRRQYRNSAGDHLAAFSAFRIGSSKKRAREKISYSKV